MSVIQQFSMSALADLMIKEEPELEGESSILEDDDHERGTVFNGTDKSMASTQYSADYETEDFDQESLCMSPPQRTDTGGDFPDDLEPLISQGDLEPESSALTGSASDSGGALSYSDSQNENSSRTLHAMPPGNKFTLSPIGPSTRSPAKGRQSHLDDRDTSFEHGSSHSMVQSSPLAPSGYPPTGTPPYHIQPEKPKQTMKTVFHSDNVNNHNRVQMSALNYGRQVKGYSAVTKLNASDVKRVRAGVLASRRPGTTGSEGVQQIGCNGEHNLNPDDIKLMREVRNVLNKIEQSDAVSQQVHQTMTRRSVAVPGVKLGSGSPSRNSSSNNNINLATQRQQIQHQHQLRSQYPVPTTKHWSSGSETVSPSPSGVEEVEKEEEDDSSGVFSKMSFYDEDDTRDVNINASSASAQSHIIESAPRATSDFDDDDEEEVKQGGKHAPPPLAGILPDGPYIVKKRSESKVNAHRLKHTQAYLSCPQDDRRHSPPACRISPEDYSSLASLASETYATFLSDIIEIAKARASANNVSSTEELAMHRALSEYLFHMFGKPNTVETVRNSMIDAAIALRSGPKHFK